MPRAAGEKFRYAAESGAVSAASARPLRCACNHNLHRPDGCSVSIPTNDAQESLKVTTSRDGSATTVVIASVRNDSAAYEVSFNAV